MTPAPFALLVVTAALGQAAPKVPTITITPAPEPVPALRYLLLPDRADEVSGNAATLYFLALNWVSAGNWQAANVYKEIDQALAAPLKMDELVKHDVLGLRRSNPFMLKQLDEAARRSYCDWGLSSRLKADGFQVLLPEIQALRNAGKVLAVRIRMEIAQRQFDKAAYSLQTGLAMAHDLADGPTLIQALVGAAIAQLMLDQVEDWIRMSGSPNLYWALSQLPRPFLSLEKPSQGERLSLEATIPLLKDALKRRIEPGQLPQLADQIDHAIQLSAWSRALSRQTDLVVLCMRFYPDAKKALIAAGRKPEEVETLPVLQVVLLDSWNQMRRKNDEQLKWLALPYWQALPALAKQAADWSSSRSEATLLEGFGAAYSKVFWAMAKLDRRIAALRTIEAIRLYAAAHEGRLPAKLSDITQVPVPIDPTTGKEFDFRLTGTGAQLWGLGDYAPHAKVVLYDLNTK